MAPEPQSFSTSEEYSKKVKEYLSRMPSALPDVQYDEDKTRNAAAFMTAFLVNRLSDSSREAVNFERSTYSWDGGKLNFRNAVKDHLWTNLRLNVVDHLRELAGSGPASYVMTCWLPQDTFFHLWVIPENVVFGAIPNHPARQMAEKRTIRILPDVHLFEQCEDSPYLSTYYIKLDLTDGEYTKLVEASKIDEAARARRRSPDLSNTSTDDDSDDESTSPGYTTATVKFLHELQLLRCLPNGMKISNSLQPECHTFCAFPVALRR
ncbi:hypothetical protein ACFL27_18150 [candidate division CSSED10-310 bacterium]|uniref:Uncharacterized protein n=1 Tax=candidate division CSSED10-310 bacterium TaxID=2855610 RepID=A0ABV6Z0Z7_UNCC1